MNWNSIPQEEPSIIFPVGAIIEDNKAVYKILEFQKQDKIHKYKTEVLSQKLPIPDSAKPFIDEKFQYILVLPQNLDKIKRIA